jgi:hypothetical protein
MDEARFWEMIEAAWTAAGGPLSTRQKLDSGKLTEEQVEALLESMEEMIPALQAHLDKLPAEALLVFDQILERKLYDLDRADVQEHTDGSDDGFLYARGFIVAAGKDYYDAVNVNPSVAMADLECEDICYLSWHIYEDKFGEVPASGIVRESGFNRSGWPGRE